MNKDKQQYWVGIDGGGTKCRAILFDANGDEIAQGLGGPANIARYQQTALESMLDAVKAAVASAGLDFEEVSPLLDVCAGLAGAFLPSSQQLLTQWEHPFGSFVFTSDLQVALIGAHGGEEGAVIITGTGSCAATLERTAEGYRVHQLGGYGFQLGDQSSGAWLGRQAVQQALLHADGIVDAKGLYDLVTGFYQCQTATEIVERLNRAQPGEFAQLAPGIFALANQDSSAAQIVQAGADYLNALAERVLSESSHRLVCLGGLAQKWLPLLSEGVKLRLSNPAKSAEWGAMHYARMLHASRQPAEGAREAMAK